MSEDSGGPTVVQLPERNDAQAAGDRLRREMDAMIDTAKAIAKYRRAAYLAYLAEGFTVDEALHLCTK